MDLSYYDLNDIENRKLYKKLCSRCGTSFGPEDGIYGLRIETANMYDCSWYPYEGTKIFYLCGECRKEFISFSHDFMKEK